MFDLIAERYDLLNRLTSLGLDQGWRQRAVRELRLPPGGRLLDLATGTADVALMALNEVEEISAVGLDPSPSMLRIARAKAVGSGLSTRVALTIGDAEALPFPDASFDGVSIAFGIRNVPDRRRALSEMARVTRTGGRVGILELIWPEGGAAAVLARAHVRFLVPVLGGLLSGGAQYRYLRDSIRAFPEPGEFCAQMERAGLRVREQLRLGFGACGLFIGEPQ